LLPFLSFYLAALFEFLLAFHSTKPLIFTMLFSSEVITFLALASAIVVAAPLPSGEVIPTPQVGEICM
jgi:hypothetical protein